VHALSASTLPSDRVRVRCAVCGGLVWRNDAGTWLHDDLTLWALRPHDVMLDEPVEGPQ
jgi:hypothetical protein